MLMIINLGFLPRKQRTLRSNYTKAPQIRLCRNLFQHLRDGHVFDSLRLI